MKLLLTGGAGYIGSHTCVELLSAGYEVVIYDNFSNSNPIVIERIKQITGKTVSVIQGDIRDKKALIDALVANNCEAVMHFAGLKAVGKSVEQPLSYYQNNVAGTVSLLNAMQVTGRKSIVFSSSATVYGVPQYLPLTEAHPRSAVNPYGRSKLIIEDMLYDVYQSDPTWKINILRYFNPAGAHQSGLIGEDPQAIPDNLMPFITQVATGRRDKLNILGNDYPTPDCTGVRDYIHVVDLARGHCKAIMRLEKPQYTAINLGTGRGYSVLDVVKAFEVSSGRSIPYQIAPRRAGDVASCFADPTRAESILGWKAEFGLESMCRDAWNWQQHNPSG